VPCRVSCSLLRHAQAGKPRSARPTCSLQEILPCRLLQAKLALLLLLLL
jgi:hypothetical protein